MWQKLEPDGSSRSNSPCHRGQMDQKRIDAVVLDFPLALALQGQGCNFSCHRGQMAMNAEVLDIPTSDLPCCRWATPHEGSWSASGLCCSTLTATCRSNIATSAGRASLMTTRLKNCCRCSLLRLIKSCSNEFLSHRFAASSWFKVWMRECSRAVMQGLGMEVLYA